MTSLTAIELFAGGGGLALGLGLAGFDHLALVEWWAPAVKVLRHNAGSGPGRWTRDAIIDCDVRQAGGPTAGMRPDLLAGGPPCQPFSLAGVHAGDNDARNMFPAAVELVRAFRPSIVVFENVPGLLRPGFAPYLEYVKEQLRRPSITPTENELWNEHHRRILNSGAASEYHVYQQEIDAADLGVAQTRRRVFIVAIRSDKARAATWPGVECTHSRDRLLYDQYVTGTYWDRHGLRRRPVPQRISGKVKRLRIEGSDPAIKPWVTLRDLLVDVPRPTKFEPEGWPNHLFIPGARTYPSHTGSPIDLPSKTIKAGVHGVSGGEAMIRHLNGAVRYLTIREAALAQGFPRDYEFPGPRSRMMGVIGNAVAVRVASTIGSSLIQMFA